MQSMHALPSAGLHVLRHAARPSARIQHARRDERAADFGGPGLPKGSKILRPEGLEGLEAKEIGCSGSNTPWGRRIYASWINCLHISVVKLGVAKLILQLEGEVVFGMF